MFVKSLAQKAGLSAGFFILKRQLSSKLPLFSQKEDLRACLSPMLLFKIETIVRLGPKPKIHTLAAKAKFTGMNSVIWAEIAIEVIVGVVAVIWMDVELGVESVIECRTGSVVRSNLRARATIPCCRGNCQNRKKQNQYRNE